ncbi:phage major capsid protein [Alteromonas sp.]|uniref:phage major capsid protein n=1 Tax=Alteromonas sp. TaxID=232 RepID=UPI00257F69C4|nr:phage major capsid protein [Alteromonas sp.]NQY17764.1 phage major capsid protein [Alteromonas sp.]
MNVNKVTAAMLRKGQCPVMQRDMEAQIEKVDEESRIVTLSFSSEYEVERWGWVETLGHDEGECDLARINNKGPFLSDHNWNDQRGVIQKAWIEKGRGYAEIKLSRNPLGQQLLIDMQDEIRVNVSVGYRIHAAKLIREENDLDYYRVTHWEPLEISSVSVPADPTVGVGRNAETNDNPVKITTTEVRKMDDIEIQDNNAPDESADRSVSPETTNQTKRDFAEPRKVKTAPEVSDAQRIAETARQYGATDLGNSFIAKGRSYEEFNTALIRELHGKRKDPEAESTMINLDIGEKELRKYSVINALRAVATGNFKNAGLEREVSEAIAQRVGRDADGIYLSYEAMGYGLRQMQLARMQSAGTSGKGAELVATELHAEMYIEALRAQAVVGQLGARMVSGLVGDVDIPKQNGSATFYWVEEDGAATDSDLSFTTVQLRPKTLATAVPITRRIMNQSTPDIEALVMADIMRGQSLGLDQGALYGSGLGNEPTGIANTSGIGAVSFATPNSPTWAETVQFETDVAEANADANTMAYLMRPSLRGKLKTTEKASGTGQFIWQNGRVNDYNAAVTTQMNAGRMLFGDFSQALIGLWGALDVVPDRATKVASGGLVMRLFQDADVAVRHPQAFCLGE